MASLSDFTAGQQYRLRTREELTAFQNSSHSQWAAAFRNSPRNEERLSYAGQTVTVERTDSSDNTILIGGNCWFTPECFDLSPPSETKSDMQDGEPLPTDNIGIGGFTIWECQYCKYDNDEILTFCEMCELENPNVSEEDRTAEAKKQQALLEAKALEQKSLEVAAKKAEELKNMSYFHLKHCASGLYARKHPTQSNRWDCRPDSQDEKYVFLMTNDTKGRNPGQKHIRAGDIKQYMRHYSGDADCFFQNYTDNDTAWLLEAQPGGHVVIKHAQRERWLAVHPTDGYKLYVPDAQTESNALNRLWDLEPTTAPPLTLPTGARAITLQHVDSKLYAARNPSAHWRVKEEKTILLVMPDSKARPLDGQPHHIRALDESTFMRHYRGDHDCFTQSYTDGDTAWVFTPSPRGHTITYTQSSAGNRYLMPMLSHNDQILRCPSNSENSSAAAREWIVTWDVEVPGLGEPVAPVHNINPDPFQN